MQRVTCNAGLDCSNFIFAALQESKRPQSWLNCGSADRSQKADQVASARAKNQLKRALTAKTLSVRQRRVQQDWNQGAGQLLSQMDGTMQERLGVQRLYAVNVAELNFGGNTP